MNAIMQILNQAAKACQGVYRTMNTSRIDGTLELEGGNEGLLVYTEEAEEIVVIKAALKAYDESKGLSNLGTFSDSKSFLDAAEKGGENTVIAFEGRY